ncbi:MAG: leucyl aminopeptidase [Alphaproteobacteria bacterium]|nr:leucyl aminopeptidase [Alphaproteobacteria bacterium]MDE2337358.1 leucyl aminopeptidase [Alphaproteobacteria bacterium]
MTKMSPKISFAVSAPASGTASGTTVTVGTAASMRVETARAAGEQFYKYLKAKRLESAVVDMGGLAPDVAAQFADGLLRASYTFNKYKTSPQKEGPQDITITTAAPQEAEAAFAPLRSTTESAFWASDFVNEPANVLNPATYAARVKAELEPLGITVRVIEADEMKKLGMNAALAVGQGSVTPPCMVVLEYDGTAGAQKKPLALVGKGITFDSGGISLKPGTNMGNMTMDMGGSAAVAGALRALASRGAKAHVVGVLALAENMPDRHATRPGDIVKSLSGKTVYIGNTDAEGRLVLCDAIAYVQQKYDPHTVVDLATLTGAAAAALGDEFAAAFTNDKRLMGKFNKAAAASGERVWQMPLEESKVAADAVRNTPHADLTNNAGAPGALTAAAFLREFIEKNKDGSDKRKFMHLDIAGPGMPKTELKGWGVFLLNELVGRFYEQKAAANQNAPKTDPLRKRPKL